MAKKATDSKKAGTSRCPITREQFNEKADPIEVKLGESSPVMAMPKNFSTGSLGWYLNGKTAMRVDGKLVEVQIGLNLTIIGSKELPGFEPTEE